MPILGYKRSKNSLTPHFNLLAAPANVPSPTTPEETPESFSAPRSVYGRQPPSKAIHTETATQDLASRLGIAIAGEHLVQAIDDKRTLDLLAKHIQRATKDIVLPTQLEIPTSTTGLQRDGAARARGLAGTASYTSTTIKLCQLDIQEEELRSRVETVAVAQLASLQSIRTDIAFSDCLPPAQRGLIQQLRSAELLTDEDRRLIGISGEVLYAGARGSQRSEPAPRHGFTQLRQRPRMRLWMPQGLRPLLGCDMIYEARPWKEIGASPIIVDWLTNGSVIKFCQEQQFLQVPNRCRSAEHQTFIMNHLQELLKQGAIEKVDIPPRCISPVAVVPKKNGKLWMILNWKQLNQKVQTSRF